MMNIKKLEIRKINAFSLALSGFLYLGLGFVFLLQKGTLIFAVESLINLLVILFILAGVFQVVGYSFGKKKDHTLGSRVLGFSLNLIMAFVIYQRPQLVVSIIPLFFGVYAIFTGIIKLLSYGQYRQNEVKGKFFMVISALVLMVFGLGIIIHPLASFIPLSNLIGLFFLLYGLSFLLDALHEGVSGEKKDSIKRRIRINLPVFMVALIPHTILTKINKALETDSLNEGEMVYAKEDTDYDLEVFIHVGEKGVAALGHVDLWFEGKVMTYGSYDADTFKLKGLISDGVLIEMDDKEKYIAFSQKYMGKTLFGFGLKLTEDQKQRVRGKIADIHENLYEWEPKSKIAMDKGIHPEEPYTDYASLVYDQLKGKFYKFKEGPFKTYFALNTNCVLLADRVVGKAGIDIIKIQGLISPGAYFEYFNREFSRKNSMVITRTVYHNKAREGEETLKKDSPDFK